MKSGVPIPGGRGATRFLRLEDDEPELRPIRVRGDGKGVKQPPCFSPRRPNPFGCAADAAERAASVADHIRNWRGANLSIPEASIAQHPIADNKNEFIVRR